MGLDTTGSGYITHNASATLDTWTTGTLIWWCYPTSVSNYYRLASKGTGTPGYDVLLNAAGNAGAIAINKQCGGVGCNARTVGGVAVANAWNYIAIAHDYGAGATGQQIYRGSLAAFAAEPAYDNRDAPAGAVNDDSAANVSVGAYNSASNYFAGIIAAFMCWDVKLSLAEIQQQQFRIDRPIVQRANCVLFSNYFGTGAQPDLSGNGNNGTVTGATAAAHPPLRIARGAGFAYAVAAAAARVPRPTAAYNNLAIY